MTGKKRTKGNDPLHGDWGKALGRGTTSFCEALSNSDFKAVEASTWRQMQTAKEILKRFRTGQTGVLLADDVGLGKTYIAGIIAAIFAGTGKRVRVLAPNSLVRGKWEEDLQRIVKALGEWQESTDGFSFHDPPVKCISNDGRLMDRQIVISTRTVAKKRNLNCDLLIVDEAHRGSLVDSETAFDKLLKDKSQSYNHILLLTATPFSLDPGLVARLIQLCGAVETDEKPIIEYGKLLKELHGVLEGKNKEDLADGLTATTTGAVEAMKRYVIRHSRERLKENAASRNGKKYAKAELVSLGEKKQWKIDVVPATPEVQELLIRMDRAQRIVLGWQKRVQRKGVTNDPRFHSGWEEFRDRLRHLKKTAEKPRGKSPEELAAVYEHIRQMEELLRGTLAVNSSDRLHPKVAAVADAVTDKVSKGHSVLVFCHHIRTAIEIGSAIDAKLSSLQKENHVRIAANLKDGEYFKGEKSLIVRTDREIQVAINDFNKGYLRVLVATDKLSESLDLHQKCTHLVHFEYSPSPLRTIQREGRLLRIKGGKKEKTPRSVYIAVPVFAGTRDERLVKIMGHRLKAFDLLLGGVRDVKPEDEENGSEEIRQQVFELVEDRVAKLSEEDKKKLRLSVN